MDCKCNPVGAQAPTVQASSTALRDKEAIRCHPFGWHLSLVAITRHPEEGHARGWGACLVKTITPVKTNATPRPIIDSDHLNGLNSHNGHNLSRAQRASARPH